jgi:6-pyruvoyltetrahydropterin/6-carboxytetrahydropterin synthase
VIDINVLKRLVEAKLLSLLDHRNLNLDVAYFKDVNPTAENLVVFCWQTLAPLIPVGTLRRLRLWETPRIYVDYDGR